MSNVNAYVQTFAGGEFGEAMSARTNIDSYQASCELAENWFNRAQGPMDRRPPTSYLGSFVDSSKKGILKGFEFDVGQNYPLLIVANTMSFYLNDGALTVPNVTAAIANSTFSNFTSWSDASDSGASASASNNCMNLASNGISISRGRTTFTVNEANVEHILTFDVIDGPVNLLIGTSAGAGNLLKVEELRRGHHRLAFTPTATGTTHIQFWHDIDQILRVDNVQFLYDDFFSLPTPWSEAQLRGIFTTQDGDRLYMFHRNAASRVLERRGHRSWSLIYFEPDDGPFDPGISSVAMSVDARFNAATLTSDVPYFVPGDYRRLIRITHPGQYVKKSFNTSGLISKSIKVSGLAADRAFTIAVSGTFTGTLTIERSVGNENAFAKVITKTGTGTFIFNDSYPVADAGSNGGANDDALYTASQSDGGKGRLDNQTVFYRVSVYPSGWTSGIATVELSVNSGSQTGVGRIVGYFSSTQVFINVIRQFSRTGQSDVWDIGAWSDENEWPNIVTFAHGRLWAFRRKQVASSAPDDYFSFQDGVNADNSVLLTLRSRSAEGVRWARELDFLCVGTRNEEYVIRSTSPNEPIGPTTAEPTLQGEEGGALIEAAIGGDSIVYVHRNERRLMQFSHNPRALSESSFLSIDLTRLNPESCEDGIVTVVVQQEPERRIYVVLKSGIVKPSLFRREEEIMGWATMTTDGFFEDALVLREGKEDAVYFIVRRLVNGAWVRMLERMRSEVVLNDEDLVHLDSMLETPIDRRDFVIISSALDVGATTLFAVDGGVFVPGDVGKIVWMDEGRVKITAYTSSSQVSGNILYPMRGKLDYAASQTAGRPVYIPRYIPPGKWGIAAETTVVTGLNHLEGRTVHVWADMAYMGTRVVSGGSVTLAATSSRIFVGLNFVSVWKSLRLAYGGTKGTAVNQKKKVNHMGLLLDRTSDTILMGDTPGKLKKLVTLSQGAALGGASRFLSGEAHETFEGTFDVDPRIIIATQNPGPATIKAIIPNVQINERG